MQSKGFTRLEPMPLGKHTHLDAHFGSPQERLEYLVDMIKQLQSMATDDYPTVSRHLQAAAEEADRLGRLRSR